MTILAFARALGHGPALLHPPVGREWWRVGGGLATVDGDATWWIRDDRAWCAERPAQAIHPVEGGFVGWEGTAGLRGGPEGLAASVDLPTARGPVARRDGRWTAPGAPLPDGASRAAALFPSPDGRAVLWADEGFLYRRGDGGIRAIAESGPEIAVGPGGSVVLDGDRGAAPNRPIVALEVAVSPSAWLRFSADGERIAGATSRDTTAILSLRTGRLEREEPGLPVDFDVRFHPDVGRVGEVEGLVEATPALGGELLAGPGGAIWDLRTGARLSPWGVVSLGATTPLDGGFLTVRWDQGEARLVGPDGATRWTCRFPLDEQDVVGWADGALVGTAGGAVFRVGPDGAQPQTRGRRPRAEPEPDGPIPLDGAAVVGGRRWGWRTDGLLAAW